MTLDELKAWVDKETDKARLDSEVTLQAYTVWLQVQQKLNTVK